MADTATEQLDVVIIGAGVSGIGAGCHLTMKNPHHRFAILEGRDAIGGTWDLFRYPGVRSDSDMYTFGYSFRPWTQRKDIADAQDILNYLKETAAEYGVDRKIRFGHRVTGANWCSEERRWTLTGTRDGEPFSLRCNFLITCTGYYNYEQGYLPEFQGYDDFEGTIAHPQHWPEALDYDNKRVLVIGSGATAVTLVPAMARRAAQVTLLQRSPTYIFSRPAIDPIALWANRLLPAGIAYKLMRLKNALLSVYIYSLSRRKPDKVRQFLKQQAARELGPEVPVDPHFTPNYNPWDQRMCLIPDGDLFAALRSGAADIVTDRIRRFTKNGVELSSGKLLDADIIVPATGLQVEFLAGMSLSLDGKPLQFNELLNYRGMMFNGVPNLATVFGYTNASWTLKADLTCDYVCRLLNHMDRHHYDQAMPSVEHCKRHAEFTDMERQPIVNLSSGYILRALDRIPRQGTLAPWRNNDNVIKDMLRIRYGRLDDGVMTFE
ncbi:flavin-containing monooxygenase [Aestuariirhabdus litorea]|uniref:NAD(P)/FAD-dependent oxidoreductase n=1 Tax=Aestuariirhabdus litorea TaxID=2528527 RepID=A0A3P3VKK1_9GAMM|nr:NAD(P)/FAD-dependent oxidoreductase [Aestuariirhabdus litorea]RRJ82904.1 NAD(P)/FAD-dependent oxidoreductase [Aestuariirhabdus litorea]RWW93063.1 NAD(P)/FAD-dependent oxidoreductase [Endozoicomonadaceae bacterium GTF-13]